VENLARFKAAAVVAALAKDLRTGGGPRRGRLAYEEVKQRLLTAAARYPDGLKQVLAAIGLVKN